MHILLQEISLCKAVKCAVFLGINYALFGFKIKGKIMKRVITAKRVLILFFICLAAYGVYKYTHRGADSVKYITVEAKNGTIRRVVNATGEIGSANLVSVGAQVSGQIEKLYVELGQYVKKGDMIAQIDSKTQQNELDINKAKLKSYEAQLESAKIALKVAETKYNREKKLSNSNATSKANLEDAENSYASAKSSVTEIESLIAQTRISVDTAQTNMSYTKIASPLDGIVVSIPVKEGQTVNSNQTTPTIVQVADLSRMEILMEISEGDITKVSEGMDVSYTVLSEPGRVFTARLTSIDPGLTKLTNGSYTGVSSSDEAVYYYGRTIVDNEDGRLRIGMTTQNTIVIGKAENVIVLPNLTVKKEGEQSVVYVLTPQGEPERRVVQTGLSDNTNTEIKSGLKAGESVISSQMTAKEIASEISSGNALRGPR